MMDGIKARRKSRRSQCPKETTPVKKKGKLNVNSALSVDAPRVPKDVKFESPERELYDLISMFQSMVESAACRVVRFCEMQRKLVARQMQAQLSQDTVVEGVFAELREALTQELDGLRHELCDFSLIPRPEVGLHLMMRVSLKDIAQRTECYGEELEERTFQSASQIIFVWNEMVRLCDLSDLPPVTFSPDASDLLAAAASQMVPSEERLKSIIVAGATCVSLLKDFCKDRGIETR
jgi:hypothetical protein